MLHGWGASRELFAPVAAALPGWRSLIPDLPGFGGTPPPPQAWSVEDYARWVLALLDRCGIERTPVVGHSFGGRVAIKLATIAPARVERLILTASAGIRPRQTLGGRLRVRTYKLLRGVEKAGFVPQALRDSARARADRRGSEDYRNSSGSMRGTFVRVVNEDLRPLLSGISCPTLLVWGDRDTETPIADARLMEAEIPDAGLVVFAGRGHYAYIEEASRFASIVDVFCRGEKP